MSDFANDLQRALGSQYRLDRELGGGGMSRVFVAEETALGRQVVIKLLPPEFSAAVSAERFRREIQLVARLQHPHIVPVLSAGEANGLLYYTMPFIDGRSLRERIARAAQDGPVSADDAARIMREVAGALAYAHAQGLVHRDIKPDNVLLSQGHALVTDFGIAKALSGTAGDVPAGTVGGLTGMGMSIGTPAYMAPEQGVGDPATDHRADLYSLGVMTYELLAGRTPFADRTTTHALLMAHMVEAPPPLDSVRPGLPPALVSLVMRCLAKSPDERPANGDAIVQALQASSDHGARPTASGAAGTAAPRRRSKGTMAALGALTAGVIGIGAYAAMTRDSATAAVGASPTSRAGDDRVTVTAFANETGDASLDPVGRMTADWLTTALAGTGLMKVVDARASMGASGSRGDVASAVQTARDLGAGTVVTGSYYKLGDSLQFDVKVLDARTSEIVQALPPVKALARDPSAAIDLVRQRTLGALATRFSPQLAYVTEGMSRPPSYDAYQQIVRGMDAFHAKDMRSAVTAFTRASVLDTGSVLARTWLLEALEHTGQLAAADSLTRELEARRERLSPLEQAQLDEFKSSIRPQAAPNLAAMFRVHQLVPSGYYRGGLVRKLMRANRWQEALDTLDAVPIDSSPSTDKESLWDSRVLLLHRLERFDEQRTLVRTLGARAPSARWTFEEARALAAMGRTDSLDALVARAVAEATRSAPAGASATPALVLQRSLADELQAHGHKAAAERLLRRLLASYDRAPADSQRMAPVRRGRAEVLARLGQWPEAWATMKPLVGTDTSLAFRVAMAVGAARAGERSAAATLERELATRPVDPFQPASMLYTRARLAMARGDRPAALALLDSAQRHFLQVYDVMHGQTEFAELRGDPGLAALLKPMR